MPQRSQMTACQIAALHIITAHIVRLNVRNTSVQQHKGHAILIHIFQIRRLIKIREVQYPVNRERDRCMNQLFGQSIVQLHAKDHQVIVCFPQLLIHPVQQITEVLVMEVIDNNRNNMTAPRAQGRCHGSRVAAERWGSSRRARDTVFIVKPQAMEISFNVIRDDFIFLS